MFLFELQVFLPTAWGMLMGVMSDLVPQPVASANRAAWYFWLDRCIQAGIITEFEYQELNNYLAQWFIHHPRSCS